MRHGRLTDEERAALHRAGGQEYRGSVEAFKQVRERTSAGFTDCKLALIACNYDIDRACALIPRIGLA